MRGTAVAKGKITKVRVSHSRMQGSCYHVKRDGVVVAIVRGDAIRGWSIRGTDDKHITSLFTSPGPLPKDALDIVIAHAAELHPA